MRIAKTRSGRIIPYNPQEKLDEFNVFLDSLSNEDIFDLYLILQYICIKIRKERRRDRESYQWWVERFYTAELRCSEQTKESLKTRLGLYSFDEQLKFAHQMIDNFWRIDSF